jgi:ABC-type antimicrobial peptide transport system permease subunit
MVTGVAKDTKYERFGVVDGPQIYAARTRQAFGDSLMVRVAGDSDGVAREIFQAMTDLDPEQTRIPVTLRSQIDDMASRFRTTAGIAVLLGAVALFLALIGVYGVIAFSVVRRTKELGIRLALGAHTGDIVRCVTGSSMRPLLAGLAVGGILAASAGWMLSQVFKNTPATLNALDPIPYLGVAIALVTTAVAAMLRPALRAANADPARALRQD